MRNRITLICAMLSVGAMGQAQQSGQSQGLLSRLRGEAPSTRQQLQNESVQVAQPANAPQGYAPGVTFPQQQQQQPVQAYPAYPAYPPQQQPQQPPYNMAPGAPAPPRPTATPARSRSSSNNDDDDSSNRSSSSSSRSRTGSSRSSNNDSDNDSNNSSSSRRSSSSSSSSKSDDSDSKKSSSSEKKTESSEKKTEAAEASENKSSSESNSGSSALQKIVKKVESGKEDESEEAKPVKKTKEEIEAEKAREAALKSADKATTVVASFLKLANDGYYSKATDHLAPAITKYFNSEISAVNGTQKTVLDELTANGTITMVTYVNTTVRGEGAVVEAELGYENGRTTRRTFDLIELEDEWKIVLPVTPEAVAAHKAAAPAAAPAPQTAAAQPAVAPPPTPEQAAANAAPLVLAPTDQATSAPAQ